MMEKMVISLFIFYAVLSFSSIRTFNYSGESMNFIEGSIIISILPPSYYFEKNDIIVFDYDLRPKGSIPDKWRFIGVHRIVGFCQNGVITKGDNNEWSDGCIDKNDIIGKVIACI